jgi:hypothetical protein
VLLHLGISGKQTKPQWFTCADTPMVFFPGNRVPGSDKLLRRADLVGQAREDISFAQGTAKVNFEEF